MNKNRATLEAVKWGDVRELVREIKPSFADVIDLLDPQGSLVMYKVRYPFGSVIIQDGIFHLPTSDGRIAPITDDQISDTIRNQLSYSGTIPMGIVLHNSVELFLPSEERIIPFTLMCPGRIFGLSRALDPPISFHAGGTWQMTAGARSMFVLPKITDYVSYKKICRARSIKLPMPDKLLDHGPLLIQMSKHKDFQKPWFCELLCFPADFLKEHNDAKWIKFRYFLYEDVWETSAFWRNKYLFDFIWDSFVIELNRQNARLRITPHAMTIVQLLIMIGLGVLPGFSPAVDDEEGPVGALQDDFYKIYGLKKYAATLMVPKHFSITNVDRPIYWSFQLPTYLATMPKPKTVGSTLSLMHEVHAILTKFCEAARENKLKGVIGTPIQELVKKIQFDFFHSEHDPEGIIRPSKEMPLEDKSLIGLTTKYGKKDFSEVSPFVRGCVRISVTKEKR